MEQKIAKIKTWLGSGSINIFGLPMSGKDTVGVRLAQALNAEFLSSGIMIRAMEAQQNNPMTKNGKLIPTDLFYDVVLPCFARTDLAGKALILSSVGRWSGEETKILSVAESNHHPIRAVIALDLPETEVWQRWQVAKESGDRGLRLDDINPEVFQVRLTEFAEKTLPVLDHYDQLGLLSRISAVGTRDEVFTRVLEQLSHLAAAAN